MKKHIYTFIILHLAVCSALAQSPIVLNTIDLNNLVQKDTLFFAENLEDYSSFGEPKTNFLWDFSDITYQDSGVVISQGANTSTDFPTASFTNASGRVFSAGLRYDTERYSKASTSGVDLVGEAVLEDQILPLQASTGNANDQLVFPKQAIPYGGVEVDRRLPSSFGDSWMSDATRSTNFNITITAFGLNNTPGVYRAYESVMDTVVGWGEVRIRQARTGIVSGKVAVQQVHRKVVRIDSFFLGGNPAPVALTNAFGLVQGGESTRYFCLFYRQGETVPLAFIEYADSDYTEAEEIEIHQDNVMLQTASISSLSTHNKFSVYPNPVKDIINVDLPVGNLSNWSYAITNMQGQNVMQANLGETNTISISNDIANGMYLFTLINNGLVQSSSRIAINR